ncbi:MULTISPECIES: DUF485 domain-containing protein [unclassified Streptomyces]|uniref:DUF485 domain-containing protein n=1 Tax=Streptomyces sp. SID8379 TaxID=2690359 RepID=UPI000996CF0B|nr:MULTISPECIES: DUF485 domain-containing protein [unclassified Streptomyces]
MGTRPKWAADKESSVEKHDGRETAQSRTGDRGAIGDPWYDALASGWGELDGSGAPAPAAPAQSVPGQRSAAGIYLEVQRSAAFQEVRGRYRRFVVPAVAVFFTWYVAYVVAATTAPDLMARPVAGAVNVAMVAGLGQFASTFLLTWLYARHARLRRDRPALELRWDTQEMTRGIAGSTSMNGSARGEGGQW